MKVSVPERGTLEGDRKSAIRVGVVRNRECVGRSQVPGGRVIMEEV